MSYRNHRKQVRASTCSLALCNNMHPIDMRLETALDAVHERDEVWALFGIVELGTSHKEAGQ